METVESRSMKSRDDHECMNDTVRVKTEDGLVVYSLNLEEESTYPVPDNTHDIDRDVHDKDEEATHTASDTSAPARDNDRDTESRPTTTGTTCTMSGKPRNKRKREINSSNAMSGKYISTFIPDNTEPPESKYSATFRKYLKYQSNADKQQQRTDFASFLTKQLSLNVENDQNDITSKVGTDKVKHEISDGLFQMKLIDKAVNVLSCHDRVNPTECCVTNEECGVGLTREGQDNNLSSKRGTVVDIDSDNTPRKTIQVKIPKRKEAKHVSITDADGFPISGGLFHHYGRRGRRKKSTNDRKHGETASASQSASSTGNHATLPLATGKRKKQPAKPEYFLQYIPTPYICIYCCDEFEDHVKMKLHYKKEHRIASASPIMESVMRAATMYEHSDGQYFCSFCPKRRFIFHAKEGLMFHMKTFHL